MFKLQNLTLDVAFPENVYLADLTVKIFIQDEQT